MIYHKVCSPVCTSLNLFFYNCRPQSKTAYQNDWPEITSKLHLDKVDEHLNNNFFAFEHWKGYRVSAILKCSPTGISNRQYKLQAPDLKTVAITNEV